MQKREGPHEKAEIQRKVLRRGKNLVFSEDTYLEKDRVRSKVTPRKVGGGLKRRRKLSKRVGVPGVARTLGKANSHFDPIQTGSGTAPPR